jgi:NAD(P)H dehydrogenase (quinone)
VTRIAILGGGPGGYEAALVASQLGAQVTLVERDGLGGACVLWDCVPSKALIAEAELGPVQEGGALERRLSAVNGRIKALAEAQSQDIGARLKQEKVTILSGTARLLSPRKLSIVGRDQKTTELETDVVLIATGAHPRNVKGASPDGQRILNWRQIYGLSELPERLVVVGSGVTGAELANAYQTLGSHVTLVSSRERVLPGEDPDAGEALGNVFKRRGMQVVDKARAAGATTHAGGVTVHLQDGRQVEGTHCVMAVGSVPNTNDLGLEAVGVRLSDSGHIEVDRVSRTSVPGIYAAGDCTGVLMLASVAAMQGRIAMWHALGEAVTPLRLSTVAANVFTDPEIATVGVTQKDVDSGKVEARVYKLPLSTNARAKMHRVVDGFVKLFVRPGAGTVVGGVVVAPRASELIFPVSMAVRSGLTAEQMANTFSIYPSLSGSISEAARQLVERG